LFAVVCHIPPAFSHSALVVYGSVDAPEGLAAGELLLPDEPLDAPGVVLLPLPDEPAAPDVPEGLLLPELLGILPPLLPPLCAAASTGAKHMIPTKNATINVFM
jgi:hypothetical protein